MARVQSRSSLLGSFLLAASVLFVSVVGTVGVLWGLGKIELPFLSATLEPYVPPEGTIPVFLSVKEVPAYTKITRDHLFDLSGKPKFFHLKPEEVQERGFLTDFNQILGRVVAHDFRAGYGFREKDLLPEGTRPGVVGGTPPGKRALVLEASKVNGIYGLKAGDRFDLLASVLVEPAKPRAVVHTGVNPATGEPKKHALVKALVQNGVVVQPVATRPIPLGTVTKAQDKQVQEIVIAIDPEEIAPLTEALATGAEIVAAYRSGHPDDERNAKAKTPGTPPPPPVKTIEVLRDGKREIMTFGQPSPSARVSLSVDPLPQATGEK